MTALTGEELDVVFQVVKGSSWSMNLAKNENGSVNGEIECLLLPEYGER